MDTARAMVSLVREKKRSRTRMRVILSASYNINLIRVLLLFFHRTKDTIAVAVSIKEEKQDPDEIDIIAGAIYQSHPGPASLQDPDEIDIKRQLFTLWNHRWTIVSSVVICSVLAGIIAYTTTPIYESKGTMLISQQQNNASAGDSELPSLLSSTYGISSGSTIANELQILRSRNLSMEIADTLMKQRLMPNGRQFPVLFRSYPEDSMMTAQDTVAMRIRGSISFSQVDREADVVSVAYESPSPVEAAGLVNLAMEIYTQLSTRENRRSANSAVTFLEEE